MTMCYSNNETFCISRDLQSLALVAAEERNKPLKALQIIHRNNIEPSPRLQGLRSPLKKRVSHNGQPPSIRVMLRNLQSMVTPEEMIKIRASVIVITTATTKQEIMKETPLNKHIRVKKLSLMLQRAVIDILGKERVAQALRVYEKREGITSK